MGRPPPSLTVELRAGDKMLIAGQNGSGKSVLATALARSFDRVVVYDPKDDPAAEIPGAAVLATAREVVRGLPGRILYRPSGAELAAIPDRWDEVCRRVLEDARRGRGATALVVHELGDLATQYRIGSAFSEVIRKGRSLGITVVIVTQRPQGIPVIVRSEAQHVACFTLLDPADRDVIASLVGSRLPAERPLPLDFTWWYRGLDLRLVLCSPVSLSR
ncbi:MAG: hypothetical protein ACYDCL_21440 [Myxococcales bacterium]